MENADVVIGLIYNVCMLFATVVWVVRPKKYRLGPYRTGPLQEKKLQHLLVLLAFTYLFPLSLVALSRVEAFIGRRFFWWAKASRDDS